MMIIKLFNKKSFSKQDGDGIEEILVGAPLFTNNEESRSKNKVTRAQCYKTFRRFFRHLPPLFYQRIADRAMRLNKRHKVL
jgi:hypothetical protein